MLFWLLIIGFLHSVRADSSRSSRSLASTNFTEMYDKESKLFRKLFKTYVRDARPARLLNDTVNVSVDMMIMKINELVERDQEIIISGFLKIAWKDERLSWDPSEYGGLEWIVVPSSNIWVPDIGLINSGDMYSITKDYRYTAVADFMGNMLWVPAGKFTARCELDVTYFPFDNQTCFYRFESWNYPSDFLNISGNSISLSHYVPDQQWNLTSMQVRNYIISYEEGAPTFARVDFILFLWRKPLYFVTYTIMPALALSSLEVCSHLLPITDSSRIAFATTTLIAFSVVHASVSESMPKTSDNVPIISQYVNVVMCIIAGSLIEAFLTANCLEKAAGSMPPKWMCLFVINVLGKAVFVRGDRFRKKFAELERMVTQNRQRIIQDRGVNNSPIIRTKRRLITIHYKDDQNNIAYNHDRSPALFDSRLQKKMPSNLSLASPPLRNRQQSQQNIQNSHHAHHQHQQQQQQQQSQNQEQNQQHDCHICNANLIDSLNNIHRDITLLRRLGDHLAEKQIKELSREVWNYLFTVIDRYIFVVAICVAVITPLYLFIILPPKLDLSVTPSFVPHSH